MVKQQNFFIQMISVGQFIS